MLCFIYSCHINLKCRIEFFVNKKTTIFNILFSKQLSVETYHWEFQKECLCRSPPMDQNLLNFLQFFGNFGWLAPQWKSYIYISLSRKGLIESLVYLPIFYFSIDQLVIFHADTSLFQLFSQKFLQLNILHRVDHCCMHLESTTWSHSSTV